MSQFSRRARWLNQLFPASAAPTINDPGVRSDDVSLVQPYDGSGWGVIQPTDFISRTISGIAAQGNVILRTVGANNIIRILAASYEHTAGVLPTQVCLEVHDPVAIRSVVISTVPATFAFAVVENPIEIVCPIILPGHRIDGAWQGGDAATRGIFGLVAVEAPVGTVFYV